MIIRDDKSYLSEVDLQSIEKGIAKLGIHSIRIDRFFTEEQKQENGRMAKILSREEWSNRCDQYRKEIGEKIEKVMDIINDKFVVYQYKNKSISYSKDNWDLFFWCNRLVDGNRDMSYITLNPNSKRSIEQQIADINNVLELLKTIEYDGIEVAIQYKCFYNENKVKEIITDCYNKIKNHFIDYHGIIGKIKEVSTGCEDNMEYGFFKKGAKTHYYKMSETAFLSIAFNQKIITKKGSI